MADNRPDPRQAVAGDLCEFADDGQVHPPGQPGLCQGIVVGWCILQSDGRFYLPVSVERPALRGGTERHTVWVHPDNLISIESPTPPATYDAQRRRLTRCQADDDGFCDWAHCPQRRDGEPAATGRHCPWDDEPAGEPE